MGLVSCLKVYCLRLQKQSWTMAIIFGLVFWVTSVLYWWKFMQNATAILRMEGVFHGSTPFPKKSQVLTGSRSVWQMMVCLGIHFRFLGLLFWTSTRTEPFSWDNFCAWSPKSGCFPLHPFPSGGVFFCPWEMWKIKAAALIAGTSGRS